MMKTYEMDSSDDKWIIVENGTYRVAKYNGFIYSRINKKGIFSIGYWDFFLPLFENFKDPSVLMIGLGGGALVYQVRKIFGKNVKFDIVEISKSSLELSKKFYPEIINENIYLDDGYNFVKNTNKKYDMIILDAYSNSKIPEQFLTENFSKNVSRILKDNGLLAINYAFMFMGWRSLKKYVSILKEKFFVYRVWTYPTEMSIILICSKNNLEKMEFKNRYPWFLMYRYKRIKRIQ